MNLKKATFQAVTFKNNLTIYYLEIHCSVYYVILYCGNKKKTRSSFVQSFGMPE